MEYLGHIAFPARVEIAGVISDARPYLNEHCSVMEL